MILTFEKHKQVVFGKKNSKPKDSLEWKNEMNKLTLLISLAPNQAVSVPYGGGMTLIPLDMGEGRSP